MGWAVLDYTDKKKYTVVRCGMLRKPIYELRGNIKEEVLPFATDFKKLLVASKATTMVCERYMAQMRGKTGENVNIMLGAMSMVSGVIPMFIFPAVQWKAAIKREWGLTKVDDYYKDVNIKQDHAIDAVLMGVYYLNKFLEYPIKNRKTLAKEIEQKFIGEYPK